MTAHCADTKIATQTVHKSAFVVMLHQHAKFGGENTLHSSEGMGLRVMFESQTS